MITWPTKKLRVAKMFSAVGLFLNITGALMLAFVVRVPILPVCNETGKECIAVQGKILELPSPSENPFLLKLGIFFIINGFILQFFALFTDDPPMRYRLLVWSLIILFDLLLFYFL